MLKAGEIRYNGQHVSPALFPQAGSVLTICEQNTLPIWEFEVKCHYIDDDIAIVYKPPGVLTSGNSFRTLRRALPHTIPISKKIDGLRQPEPVHRLDQRAQGLLLIARTTHARAQLGHFFEHRQIKKTYRAVCCGYVSQKGQSLRSLDGLESSTLWKPLRWTRSIENGWLTELSIEIQTGRKHQIRRHLSYEGHPLLGEDVYIDGRHLRSKGLFLMAERLQFPHPSTGNIMDVKAPPPAKFHNFLYRQEQRWVTLQKKRVSWVKSSKTNPPKES